MKQALLTSVLCCLFACSSSPTVSEAESPFTIELRAVSEEGTPLGGVGLAVQGRSLGTTTADGRLVREVRGTEGSSLRTLVTCPIDHEEPEQPGPLKLTRVRAVGTQAAQSLAIAVRCRKRLSTIGVVVRAERGENLPVLVDGKPVAETDAAGVAHLLLRRPRADKSVQLAIDTSSRGALKPANPTRTYELHGRDAVVLFEPSFVVNKPQGVRVSTPRPRRHVPVRVD